jgi:ABC-type ATPase involved in cell division
MHVIELTDYTLSPVGNGNGLQGISFALSEGDVCAIAADEEDDAIVFLRALGTLTLPVNGTYRFRGKNQDLSDYRRLLPIKKKIGYVAQDSAMISNRTVRENLLLMRNYFENSLFIDLDESTAQLCRKFDLEDKLDMRPGALNPLDLQIAITIRELSKSPEVLLMDRPEDYVGHTMFNLFVEVFKDLLSSGIAMVVLSFDKLLVETVANRKIMISNGTLEAVSKP